MGLKDLLLTAHQAEKSNGEQALYKLLNTPRYDKHIKHLEPKKPQPRTGSTRPSPPVRQSSSSISSPVGKSWSQRLAEARQTAASTKRDPGVIATGFPSLTNDPEFKSFMDSIAQQESGGNYSAVGVPTRSGQALGKYQVLDSNIEGPGGWDKETLGRDISAQEFLNSPELQEKVAQTKLAAYYKDYGAAGAAKAWYGGPGAVRDSNAPQYGGPSINGYANSVVSRMR